MRASTSSTSGAMVLIEVMWAIFSAMRDHYCNARSRGREGSLRAGTVDADHGRRARIHAARPAAAAGAGVARAGGARGGVEAAAVAVRADLVGRAHRAAV